MVEPMPALSLGMLAMLTRDSSAMRFFSWPRRARTNSCRCLAMWYSAFSLRSPMATAFFSSFGKFVIELVFEDLEFPVRASS